MKPFLAFVPDFDSGAVGHAMLPNGRTLCHRQIAKVYGQLDENGFYEDRYPEPSDATYPCHDCLSNMEKIT